MNQDPSWQIALKQFGVVAHDNNVTNIQKKINSKLVKPSTYGGLFKPIDCFLKKIDMTCVGLFLLAALC